MAANKTFQVPRKSQYKREKPRSPLSSHNRGGRPVREGSLSKHSPVQDDPPQPEEKQTPVGSFQSPQTPAVSDQENIFPVQRNSLSSLPLLAGNLMNCSSLTASPDACAGKPESRELARMLNKTLSPIGTPERFRKIMPHIYSDSPLSTAVQSERGATSDADSGLTGTPVPSLKDALALIDSDLSQIHSSPLDVSSSRSFSDLRNSMSGGRACKPQREFFQTSPDGPPMEPEDQQPTFSLGKAATSEAAVPQPDGAAGKVKKSSFTSVTVTKGKAPAEASGSSGRKIKKSRRRLLEKTLELCDGSSCESGAGSPNLPVIELHAGEEGRQKSRADGFSFVSQHQESPTFTAATTTCPVTSPPPVVPATSSASFSSPTPAAAAPTASFPLPSPSPLGSSSPLHHLLSPGRPTPPPPAKEDLFPVHKAAQGQKRKSEEFTRNDGKVAELGRTERVKRSRVVSAKAEFCPRSAQERRSASQRQPARAAGRFTPRTFTSEQCAPVSGLHSELLHVWREDFSKQQSFFNLYRKG